VILIIKIYLNQASEEKEAIFESAILLQNQTFIETSSEILGESIPRYPVTLLFEFSSERS